MPKLLNAVLLAFGVLYLVPLGFSAFAYWTGDRPVDFWSADRSSAGLLPAAAPEHAVVRIFSARTVRWRGIFATHSWIVVKERGAATYDRFDYTAWGDPIRVNGFVADGRWFGSVPELVFAADGAAAEALVPKIRSAIAAYGFRERGDYRAWPGPNSNTFVAAVMRAVPEIDAALPATAIGKDYPVGGRWIDRTPSDTGWQINAGGYFGLAVGWVEGIEVNILGAVAGVDLRRPGIKLPGWGRIGV